MQWRSDPQIDASRKLPGWGAFHRICGEQTESFAFDHPAREGRTWTYDCFTTIRRRDFYEIVRLSVGRGKTLLDALQDAHDRCGRATPETTAALALLIDGPPVADDDFEALLGEPDELEELLG
jgi:hypothetical protein